MEKVAKFMRKPTAPGILLVLASVLAMVMENTPLSPLYNFIKETPVVLQIGQFLIDKPLLLWINDGLMAVFFLLIGLEIKRELLEGHLSSKEKFILPAIAAMGGLIVPAIIYFMINQHDPVAVKGWAIPAATDIAFALGILLLMGTRVPVTLKVCLVAIAIIDDLAAIIIIALFYTAEVSTISLLLAAAGLVVALILSNCRVSSLTPYIIIGIFVWACVLKSGVHATLAGVALGLIIPMRIKSMDGYSPLLKLEHALHPWVAFMIIPVFAFANAGVSLSGVSFASLAEPITLGIILGLFIGKQVGVMASTFVFVKLGVCRLPDNVNWAQFYGMALLTGIGFTMSLFIGTLAFDGVEQANQVRLGVLAGSLLSGIAGVLVLFATTSPKPEQTSAAKT